MTLAFHNLAKMTSNTSGTGALTLVTNVAGFNTFANAGVQNSEYVRYVIRDGANSEMGIGLYSSTGPTLTRSIILASTNGGAAINCSGGQTVAITLAAEDIQPFSIYYGSSATFTNGSTGNTLGLDTEWTDSTDMSTFASDQVTLTRRGWYMVWFNISVTCASAFNGRLKLTLAGREYQFGYATAMGILSTYLSVGPIPVLATDGLAVAAALLDNHLGASIDAYIEEMTVWKIGPA